MAIVLQTWSKIEIPPKPNKNEANIIFMDNFFVGILQILFNPLVNSKIPEIKLFPNSAGTFNKLNKGTMQVDKISKNWLVCMIDIITENSTTKPPIDKIILIELEILFPIIPPKLDQEILSLELT